MSSSSTLPMCFLHVALLFYLISFGLLKNKLKTKQTPLKAFKDTTKKKEFAKSSKTQYFPMFYQVFIYLSFFCEKMSSSSTLPMCFLHVALLFYLISFGLLKNKLKTKQTPLKAFKDTTKKKEFARSSKTQYFLFFTKCFIYLSFFLWENELFLYVSHVFPSCGPSSPVNRLSYSKTDQNCACPVHFPPAFLIVLYFQENSIQTGWKHETLSRKSFVFLSLPRFFPNSSATLPRLFLNSSSTVPRLFLDSSSTLPRLFLDSSWWLFLDCSSTLPRLLLDSSSTLPRLFLGSSSTLPRLFLGSSLTLPAPCLGSSSAFLCFSGCFDGGAAWFLCFSICFSNIVRGCKYLRPSWHRFLRACVFPLFFVEFPAFKFDFDNFQRLSLFSCRSWGFFSFSFPFLYFLKGSMAFCVFLLRMFNAFHVVPSVFPIFPANVIICVPPSKEHACFHCFLLIFPLSNLILDHFRRFSLFSCRSWGFFGFFFPFLSFFYRLPIVLMAVSVFFRIFNTFHVFASVFPILPANVIVCVPPSIVFSRACMFPSSFVRFAASFSTFFIVLLIGPQVFLAYLPFFMFACSFHGFLCVFHVFLFIFQLTFDISKEFSVCSAFAVSIFNLQCV